MPICILQKYASTQTNHNKNKEKKNEMNTSGLIQSKIIFILPFTNTSITTCIQH